MWVRPPLGAPVLDRSVIAIVSALKDASAMTIRFRRSLKIAPGVHINFNKNSTSLSLGPRGAHYTMSSTGRRTVSAGLPGTGLYATQTINPKDASRKSAGSTPVESENLHQFPSAPPAPTLFSRRAERDFYAFFKDIYGGDRSYTVDEILTRAKALREQYDSLIYPLTLIAFLHMINSDKYDELLLTEGAKIWAGREIIFTDRLVVKYFKAIRPVTRICEGISATEIFNKQQFGFIWVEILQDGGRYDDALAVLHEMEPTQLVAISMADVELSKKDYPAVLETTEDIENEDDATAILLILRGMAFREQNLLDASLECMKLGLAKRGRSKEVLHRAHFERAGTYEKMGKPALARKDLESILVDDSSNAEVLDRIAKLDQGAPSS